MISPINSSTPIGELNQNMIRSIQNALAILGYYPFRAIDGLSGPMTEAALKEFKADNWLAHPTIVGPTTIGKLNELAHTGVLPNYRGGTREEAIEAIKQEADKHGFDLDQTAYALATVKHETNDTFEPVVEAYWLSENWRKNNLRYYPYHGRGFVQITWKRNYTLYGKLLKLDLVNNPDLALRPDVSLFILIHGMKTGLFTGLKISDFINDQKTDFVNARRVINGNDKDDLIAEYAFEFLNDM